MAGNMLMINVGVNSKDAENSLASLEETLKNISKKDADLKVGENLATEVENARKKYLDMVKMVNSTEGELQKAFAISGLKQTIADVNALNKKIAETGAKIKPIELQSVMFDGKELFDIKGIDKSLDKFAKKLDKDSNDAFANILTTNLGQKFFSKQKNELEKQLETDLKDLAKDFSQDKLEQYINKYLKIRSIDVAKSGKDKIATSGVTPKAITDLIDNKAISKQLAEGKIDVKAMFQKKATDVGFVKNMKDQIFSELMAFLNQNTDANTFGTKYTDAQMTEMTQGAKESKKQIKLLKEEFIGLINQYNGFNRNSKIELVLDTVARIESLRKELKGLGQDISEINNIEKQDEYKENLNTLKYTLIPDGNDDYYDEDFDIYLLKLKNDFNKLNNTNIQSIMSMNIGDEKKIEKLKENLTQIDELLIKTNSYDSIVPNVSSEVIGDIEILKKQRGQIIAGLKQLNVDVAGVGIPMADYIAGGNKGSGGSGSGTGSGNGDGNGTGSGTGNGGVMTPEEMEKLKKDYADLTAEVEKYKAQITETTAKLEEMKKTQAESEGDKSKIKELQASLDALNVSYAEAQNKMKEYRSELAAYESMSLVQDANGNNVNQEQYDKLISDTKQTATELENTRNQLKMLQEQTAAEKEAAKASEETANEMSVAEKSREEQKRKALERQAVQSGSQTPNNNSTPADNTTLSAILAEVKSINGKMDTSATKAGNNASPNISANQSPNNTPSSVTTPSISSEVQAASEAATAEVAAFKTIDDAVTGLTGDIHTKTEAIRAEATEMTNAAKSEVESISLIKQAVSDLATQIHNVPKVRIVGENDGKLNISANLTEEQIAVIREKLKAVFSGEQAIPISFVPNVEGLKQQIADALKNVPVEITNNNINKVIKVNKFKANSDGVEALRNSISSQLKNVKIQSFDATTAAESVKETLSKVLDGVGLKFDTEKLGNEVREAVNSGVEAASAEQKPEASDNKAVRFKEKATNDIGKLRDKYADKLQGQQLEVFKERLNEIDNKIKEIKDDASNYTDENAQVIDKDIKQIEALVNSFKEINNSEDKINSLIQKLKDSKNSIERRGAVAQPVVNNINSEMSALEELKRSGQNLNVGNPAEVQAFIDKLHEADATVESLQQSAKNIRVSTNATASVAKLDSKFNDLLFKVDKFKRDNSKITSDKGISAQFDSLLRSIQTIEKSDVNFQKLNAQFNQLKATVQGKGLTGRSLGDELKYIAEKIGIKAMLGDSIYRVIGAFRQMVGIVTELDTGMTTLRRVTEETEATYRKFLKTAGDEAHELGSTVSELVDSTGDFARLGYNIQEANALAKNAVMYSNVGWLDIQTATADMTSTMKAFNIEASDSIRIVDTFDILGKKLPLVTISVKGWRHSRPSKDIVNHNICVTTAGGVW